MTKAFNGQSSPKKDFYSPQLSMLFGKLCFSECLFSSFSHSLFISNKIMKFQLTLFQLGLRACEIIKYNGIQISEGKGWKIYWGAVLHGPLMIRLCEGRGSFTNAFFSNLEIENLKLFANHFLSSLTGKTLTSLQYNGSICT